MFSKICQLAGDDADGNYDGDDNYDGDANCDDDGDDEDDSDFASDGADDGISDDHDSENRAFHTRTESFKISKLKIAEK